MTDRATRPEDGRRVTGAGPDLEDLVRRRDCRRLHHQRNNVRLGNRLAVPDGQRTIRISLSREFTCDESVPGDLSERRQHAFVADATCAKLALDH